MDFAIQTLPNILPSHMSSSSPNIKKARLVHNYILLDPLMQREQDDVLTVTNTGVKINKKLERDYFTWSKEQWGYGNAAIMQEMIDNQELDDQGVRDYLEYTKYINRLFSKYVKGSVLLFDLEYRELQFREKFRWPIGFIHPHLQYFQLISKPNNLTLQALQETLSSTSIYTSKNSNQKRHCCFVCYLLSRNALSHPKKN